MALTIGVDIGGTKVAGGVVEEDGTVLARVRRDTPSTDPEGTEDTIAAVVGELSRQFDVEAVGLGAAGFVDERRSTVLFAPNLAWREEPLRADVQRRVGLPVVVENDANAAAWAEYRFGAGRGHDHLVMVTLGTGIGGGLILGGCLYRGGFGIGGELGHVVAVPEGHRCGCGNRGCWEQYASGKALVREAQELAATSPARAGRLLELGEGRPEGITGPEITQAAHEGDQAALDCFAIVGGWLGQGIADLASVLDPTAFVIGGGVSEAGEVLLGPARERYEKVLTGRGHRPVADVLLAGLGAEAGMVGAADLARRG
ncbi:MAG: ROK family glucokinase [Actinomycetes bacterium]